MNHDGAEFAAIGAEEGGGLSGEYPTVPEVEGVELILPDSVKGPDDQPTRFDPDHESTDPPTAYFVLYRQGTEKEHEWRMIVEILIAHDLNELLERVFDRYPFVKQNATRVKFIEADSGVAFTTKWERTTS